jgi:hypothetical protein
MLLKEIVLKTRHSHCTHLCGIKVHVEVNTCCKMLCQVLMLTFYETQLVVCVHMCLPASHDRLEPYIMPNEAEQ